jgi:hypothetical protein
MNSPNESTRVTRWSTRYIEFGRRKAVRPNGVVPSAGNLLGCGWKISKLIADERDNRHRIPAHEQSPCPVITWVRLRFRVLRCLYTAGRRRSTSRRS